MVYTMLLIDIDKNKLGNSSLNEKSRHASFVYINTFCDFCFKITVALTLSY